MFSIFDNCIGDCYNNYFHTCDHVCENDSQRTRITNNEIFIITSSDKSMALYERK